MRIPCTLLTPNLPGTYIQDVASGYSIKRNEKNERVYHVKPSDNRTLSFKNHSELDRAQQQANISPDSPDYRFLRIFHRAFQARRLDERCPFYSTIKIGSVQAEEDTLDGNSTRYYQRKTPVAGASNQNCLKFRSRILQIAYL
jgi:hypothetical protein